MTFESSRDREKWSIPLAYGFSIFPLIAGSKRPAIPWKEYQQRRVTVCLCARCHPVHHRKFAL